jgi:chromosomal replication initiator protein
MPHAAGFVDDRVTRWGLQDVTTCDTEIVSALRAALAQSLGDERYELWFGANTRVTLTGHTVRIESPNQFMQNWLRANFRTDIERCARQLCGAEIAVEFSVGDESAALAAAAPQTAQTEPAEPPCAAELPARRREFAKFDSFVVGRANRLAYTSAQLAIERLGSVSPLYLHGPTGVGKTHLLEGIWSAVRLRDRSKHVVYLSAEQFTTYFLEALHGSGLPNFRRKYRSVDVLLIDDLQFLAGKRATIGELLHTIDTLVRDGRQIVLSADRAPGELAGIGPELVTRLESGLVSRLEQPDYQTRLGIVGQLAARLSLAVPAEVQRFIAANLTSHARELAGALHTLHAASLAHGKPIDLALADETLGERIRQGNRALRLHDIEQAVCQVLGLEDESLQKTSKAKEINSARMLAMWLARKHTRAALAEIGRYFGRRSHSTVVSAQKKVGLWMADGQPVELVDRTWTIDEAIRKIESQLRVG